jgi:16S rRNA (guanine527-N7)-methyltransferase
MTSVNIEETLAQGLETLGLSLTQEQMEGLKTYLGLLQKWGKVYNLTALRDPGDMLTHHLLDSLAAVPALKAHVLKWQQREGSSRPLQLMDVGSGAGLPGVVFALVMPEIQVVCVDAVAKKAAFIQQAALALKLPNLKAVHARVETLKGPFDVITSRAFASLVDFTQWTRQALAQEGVWMAMKGKRPDEELAALSREDVPWFHVEPLAVPGLVAERCLVWLSPKPVIT